MTDNTTLDAAIEAADKALCDFVGYPPHKFEVSEADRTYARALIAKLIEGMDMACPFNEFGHGFNAAITEIKRRAGLEDLA
jgi:hypothetical protein